jgi:hypothetical protein
MSSKLDENFNPEIQDEEYKSHLYDQNVVEAFYNKVEPLINQVPDLLPKSCKTEEVMKTLNLINHVMNVQKNDTMQHLKFVHEQYKDTIKQSKEIHSVCMKLDKDFEAEFKKALEEYEKEEKRLDDE